MKNKKGKNKIFLLMLSVTMFIFAIYGILSINLKSGDIPVVFGSSLDSSNDSNPSNSSLDAEVNLDISFLNTLVLLKSISIDTSIFNNKSFKLLKDNKVKITSISPGRDNPFAPPVDSTFPGINNSSSGNEQNAKNQSVVTNQANQITSMGAILNGTLNINKGITDIYFEYGFNDQTLSNSVAGTKPSLVGTFARDISGLNTMTTYFYRACAKINNIPTCGEIVSFTTN